MRTIKFFKIAFLAAMFILSLEHAAKAQYTLTDDDVVVTGGIIQSCSYNFAIKNIIIPETLDGQTVIGIANATTSSNGVFYNKAITSVVLPSNIEIIGNYAFTANRISNSNLSSYKHLTYIGNFSFSHNWLKNIDLSACTALNSIGDHAFYDNELISLNLNDCSNLIYIGEGSFYLNKLTSLNLSACTALTSIGDQAFRENSLTSINLSSCSALISIGIEAFWGNELTSLNLNDCLALINIGAAAFDNNSLSNFALPTNMEYANYGWMDRDGNDYIGGDIVNDLLTFYFIPAPYTLSDNDVVVTNGIIESCSYSFILRSIIIPEILDGQTVIGIADLASVGEVDGVFRNNGIANIKLPSTIVTIGKRAFDGNELINLDLSTCSVLNNIGDRAFQENNLKSIDLSACIDLASIGNYAFWHNSLSNIDFSACTALASIGEHAFYQNSIINLDLSVCSSLVSIEAYAFSGNSITSLNLNNCTNLTKIGGHAFDYNELTDFDLSDCTALTFIGNYAFSHNKLTVFNLPIPNLSGFILSNWIDGQGNTYAGGEAVSDYNTSYTAILTATYTVNFTITDGTNPIQGSTVALSAYGTETTNAMGLASFSGVLPEDDIAYTVATTGYDNATGTVSVVDADVNENITLISVTGISDLSEVHISFHPNPVEGIGTFVYPSNKAVNIEIYNASGMMLTIIHDQDLNGITEINFNGYQSGLYLYRLTEGNGTNYSGKVMKE